MTLLNQVINFNFSKIHNQTFILYFLLSISIKYVTNKSTLIYFKNFITLQKITNELTLTWHTPLLKFIFQI